MRDERTRLGYRRRQDFADRAGVHPRVVSDLEGGRRKNFRPETLAAVEAVLGWAPGSIVRHVAGGRVLRASDEDLAALVAAWPRIGARGRRALRAAAEKLADQD